MLLLRLAPLLLLLLLLLLRDALRGLMEKRRVLMQEGTELAGAWGLGCRMALQLSAVLSAAAALAATGRGARFLCRRQQASCVRLGQGLLGCLWSTTDRAFQLPFLSCSFHERRA